LRDRYNILLTVIVLVLGLVLGFGGAMLSYRYGLLPLTGERPLQRMARALDLTPAQFEQIHAIMQDTRRQLRNARDNFREQRRAIFFHAYLRTRALLSPAQQRIFDERFVLPSFRAEARATQRSAASPTPMPSNSPSVSK
jgi:hypothetical protein